MTTKFNAASLGAGGAAIATGVGVNTIGTSTLAKVNQSTVTARKAAVASREELDVDQNLVGATVGGLGINANVMVTSIGTKLADMRIKKNVLIAGIVREGKLIIPGGQDAFQAGDTVIVVTTNLGFHEIENILA